MEYKRQNPTEKYYRYVDQLYSCGDEECGFYSRLKVDLHEYEVLSHTPKGVWLDLTGFNDRRWVSNNARKKFACSTKEAALESFLARKQAQLRILKSQLKNCEHAIQWTNQKARQMVESKEIL